MQIQAGFVAFQNFAPTSMGLNQCSTYSASPSCSFPAPDFSRLFQASQCLNHQQQLGAIWASISQPGGPRLAQPQEMNRNDSTRVGPHTMQVDGQGNINVDTAPTRINVGGFGPQGAFGASLSQGNEHPLRFSNGVVELPNGEKRPYGRTGVIVVMADGRQFAAGRNSTNSNENIRYVAADQGQEIPVSPPGATTVLYLDPQGNVAREDVR